MKKLLIVVAVVFGVIALVVWVATWFRAPEVVAKSASKPWPGGMGTLEAVAKRYPPAQGNDASRKLAALAKALPKNEAVDEFVWREMVRAELTIGTPPATPDVAAIRDLLLHEPVVWERRHVEVGDQETTEWRAMVMTTGRALAASALTKARAGDAAAWDDLHAAWKLARTLDGHPPMMIQTASLALARMVNALAWKMPLPAPAWLAELQQRDHLRPLLEAYQYQTASYWSDTSQVFPTKMLADSVDHDRAIAEALINATQCDVKTRMNKLGTDLSSVWRRAFRYRAEREATANALRVREGKPIETKSACSDGTWSFDGTTLRFSRAIDPGDARDMPMPLVLRLTGAPASSPAGP